MQNRPRQIRAPERVSYGAARSEGEVPVQDHEREPEQGSRLSWSERDLLLVLPDASEGREEEEGNSGGRAEGEG